MLLGAGTVNPAELTEKPVNAVPAPAVSPPGTLSSLVSLSLEEPKSVSAQFSVAWFAAPSLPLAKLIVNRPALSPLGRTTSMVCLRTASPISLIATFEEELKL